MWVLLKTSCWYLEWVSRSLDVYLNVGKEADYEMEQLKESEDN